MAELAIIAGECGRGVGTYDTGLFTLPQGLGRGVETVAAVVLHGGVEGRQSMMDRVIASLKENAACAAVWRSRRLWIRPTLLRSPLPWSARASLHSTGRRGRRRW